jgi:hypothetical protein
MRRRPLAAVKAGRDSKPKAGLSLLLEGEEQEEWARLRLRLRVSPVLGKMRLRCLRG